MGSLLFGAFCCHLGTLVLVARLEQGLVTGMALSLAWCLLHVLPARGAGRLFNPLSAPLATTPSLLTPPVYRHSELS